MRTLYVQADMGISGDMFLGMLVDLGVDPGTLRTELNKLPLSGFELTFETVVKSGVRACKARVLACWFRHCRMYPWDYFHTGARYS